jgi:hypothetical protein
MRVIDARGKPPPQIDRIHEQYPPAYYHQIGMQYPRPTTDHDIGEFRKRCEREGAVAIFISEYGQSAYIPNKPISEVTPQELPKFTYQGQEYTVDYRLKEFRRAEYGKVLEFVPFDSDKGKDMLNQMQGTVPQVIADNLLQYYKVPPEAY